MPYRYFPEYLQTEFMGQDYTHKNTSPSKKADDSILAIHPIAQATGFLAGIL